MEQREAEGATPTLLAAGGAEDADNEQQQEQQQEQQEQLIRARNELSIQSTGTKKTVRFQERESDYGMDEGDGKQPPILMNGIGGSFGRMAKYGSDEGGRWRRRYGWRTNGVEMVRTIAMAVRKMGSRVRRGWLAGRLGRAENDLFAKIKTPTRLY